jgi:hypothetical protein
MILLMGVLACVGGVEGCLPAATIERCAPAGAQANKGLKMFVKEGSGGLYRNAAIGLRLGGGFQTAEKWPNLHLVAR